MEDDFTANMIIKCGACVSSYKSPEAYVEVIDLGSNKKYKMSILEASVLSDVYPSFTDKGLIGTWSYNSLDQKIKLVKQEVCQDKTQLVEFLTSSSNYQETRKHYELFFKFSN